MDDITYKVLWVEDNDAIVDQYVSLAEEFDLAMDRFSNWEDAENALKMNFEDYSAIILDAFCKKQQDGIEAENFIPYATNRLAAIFERNQKYIPWYIWSAGTMEHFDFVLGTAKDARMSFVDEWGETYFLKDAPNGDPKNVEFLFQQIRKIAESRFQNTVLFSHRDVFAYLGKGRLINFTQARTYMLRMLEALYFPKDNLKFQYEANPLRKVLEYLFRAARAKGLLPEECFREDKVALSNCSKFMAGLNIDCQDEKGSTYKLRWGKAGGEQDGRGGDYIFDADVGSCVKNMLGGYTSPGSHTKEDEPFFIDEETKELFFSYVMQLCYVIRWFGKYAEQHPDEASNREMHRNPDLNYNLEEILKKEYYVVLNDGGRYYVGSCKLSIDCQARVKPGNKVKIKEAIKNTGKDKYKYSFIATKIAIV